MVPFASSAGNWRPQGPLNGPSMGAGCSECQESFHGARRHAVRAQPLSHCTKWLLASHLIVSSKKGYVVASTLAHAWDHLQISMVHGASYPRRHNAKDAPPDWQSRLHDQERRNRDRRQGQEPGQCEEVAEIVTFSPSLTETAIAPHSTLRT